MQEKYPISKKLLGAIAEFAAVAFDKMDAFLMSGGSASQLQRNLKISDKQYKSALQGLCRSGYIKKINDNQFLITPKGSIKVKRTIIEEADWSKNGFDGFWKIVSYDIPEPMIKQRNIYKSVLKRKGFIGLQNSVFIAPFADFKALDDLRRDLKIEKYVSFFSAKCDCRDDDSQLRKKFNLD
jgi:phenylacetic acid degradation operon negative regulatory protein